MKQYKKSWTKEFDRQFVMLDKNGKEVWTVQNFADPRHVKDFIANLLNGVKYEIEDYLSE